MEDCIFCKIVRGEVPSKKVYEDDEILAFHDINPLAPTHFMLIPKKHIGSLADVSSDDAAVLGRIMALTGRLAREQGSPAGAAAAPPGSAPPAASATAPSASAPPTAPAAAPAQVDPPRQASLPGFDRG